MKIHTLVITASADATPHTSSTYTWRYGDPLPDLEAAADILKQYLTDIKTPAAKAASATQPLDVTHD